MKITYDKIADAMYVTLKKGRVAKTEEISPNVIVDHDRGGSVLGVEILCASKYLKMSRGTRPLITIGNQTIPLPSLTL